MVPASDPARGDPRTPEAAGGASAGERQSEPGPGDLRVAEGVRIPAGELTWRFSAAGGPGGQHVNTANTRAELRFDIAHSPSLPGWARQRLLSRLGPTVAVTASDRRSQLRNRELALERLAARLAAALRREPARRPTRPSAASQRRRLDAKRRQGDRKQARRRVRPDED